MKVIVSHLRAHPRLMLAAAVGILAAIAAPGIANPVTRALLGWNVSVWLYTCPGWIPGICTTTAFGYAGFSYGAINSSGRSGPQPPFCPGR